MKKLIIGLCMVAVLSVPFVSYAQVAPTQDQINQQIIVLLKQLISALQQRIADILALQADNVSTIQVPTDSVTQIQSNVQQISDNTNQLSQNNPVTPPTISTPVVSLSLPIITNVSIAGDTENMFTVTNPNSEPITINSLTFQLTGDNTQGLVNVSGPYGLTVPVQSNQFTVTNDCPPYHLQQTGSLKFDPVCSNNNDNGKHIIQSGATENWRFTFGVMGYPSPQQPMTVISENVTGVKSGKVVTLP